MDGLFCPTPVANFTNNIEPIKGHKRVALRDPNVEEHPIIAVMHVEDIEKISDAELNLMAEDVYRTTDIEHPGVNTFMSLGRYAVSGPIRVLHFSHFQTDFPD